VPRSKKQASSSGWVVRIRMRFLLKSDIGEGCVRVFVIHNSRSKVKYGSRKIVELNFNGK
jgi:hypothetical protein